MGRSDSEMAGTQERRIRTQSTNAGRDEEGYGRIAVSVGVAIEYSPK